MTVLDTTIVNVAVHVLGRDLHTSLSTIQWVLTGYTLALSMTIPVTGWAIDRFGARRLWITSLVLFILGSVLCGIAWSPVSLIVFRALVRRALLLAVRLLPRVDEHRGTAPALDGWGLALLSPGLALLVYALSQAGDGAPASSPRVWGGVGVALALLAAFGIRAWRRGDRALVDVRLFAGRPFATAVASLFFYSVGMFGVLILVPLYDQTSVAATRWTPACSPHRSAWARSSRCHWRGGSWTASGAGVCDELLVGAGLHGGVADPGCPGPTPGARPETVHRGNCGNCGNCGDCGQYGHCGHHPALMTRLSGQARQLRQAVGAWWRSIVSAPAGALVLWHLSCLGSRPPSRSRRPAIPRGKSP